MASQLSVKPSSRTQLLEMQKEQLNHVLCITIYLPINPLDRLQCLKILVIFWLLDFFFLSINLNLYSVIVRVTI